MTKAVADVSMSLDGFVTGPNPGPEQGLGDGGGPLHAWAMGSGDDVDAEILREMVVATGAVVMGRRLFDIIDGPQGWNDGMGFAAGHAASPPFFVVTHSAPANVRLGLPFTFVTDGIESAMSQARAAAGARNAFVMGGGQVVQQCVDRGLVDELRLHLAPIVLGAGTPLFVGGERRQLTQLSVRVSSLATHVTYGVSP